MRTTPRLHSIGWTNVLSPTKRCRNLACSPAAKMVMRKNDCLNRFCFKQTWDATMRIIYAGITFIVVTGLALAALLALQRMIG